VTVGLRDLINKGKCLIGLHEGEWRAASLTVCTFTRRCLRCGAEQSRVDHSWGEWHFPTADACDQGRSCLRCSLHEQQLVHAYGAAKFDSETTCDRHEECQRCHERRAASAQHVMTSWRFIGDEDCRQVQQCSRCSTDGTVTRVQHGWADWQHSNAHDGAVRVCRRCGELQVQPAAPPAAPDHTATPAAASASNAARNPALVAHWRHTEALSGEGFSLVTDTHLVFQADGRFRRWSHSASSMGSQTSEAITGTWHSISDVLHSRADDGGAGSITFSIHDNTLFFPDGGSQKLWQRVR